MNGPIIEPTMPGSAVWDGWGDIWQLYTVKGVRRWRWLDQSLTWDELIDEYRAIAVVPPCPVDLAHARSEGA